MTGLIIFGIILWVLFGIGYGVWALSEWQCGDMSLDGLKIAVARILFLPLTVLMFVFDGVCLVIRRRWNAQ